MRIFNSLGGPRHREARRSRVRGMLAASSGIAAATLIALGAAGTTYALWRAEAPIEASAVTSGTLKLTVNDQTTFNVTDLTTTKLLPGRTVTSPTPLVLKNAGTTPMVVSIASIGFTDPNSELAQNLSVVLRQGSTCAALADGVGGGQMTGAVNFAPGQAISFCLEATLAAGAPSTVQGDTTVFTINLDAVQVRT